MSAAEDRKARMRASLVVEKQAVHDRFAMADEVMALRPSGLAVAVTVGRQEDLSLNGAMLVRSDSEHVEYAVGQAYDVPISRLRDSPFNARVFYSTEEVDSMSISLTVNGQDVDASGYFSDGHVVIIDGSKRLRGARVGGLETLRVMICPEPKDAKAVFLKSRRINRERSSQTVLDDAVRFQEMLNAKHFDNQEALAKEMETSQETISRTLAINKIPDALKRRMKDSPYLVGGVSAYAISRIFVHPRFSENLDEAIEFATDIIEKVTKDELSSRDVQALVASRLAGPRTRVRNDARPIQFAGVKGTIKTNEDKGELIFAIKGLSPGNVEGLRTKLEALCFERVDGAAA